MANELGVTERNTFFTSTVPNQEGSCGITFDFNYGARISVPINNEREWTVRIYDDDSASLLYEWKGAEATWITSNKRYYVRFHIEVFDGDNCIFTHTYDCKDKTVIVYIPVGTLGDNLAWFPYAEEFRKKHGAKVVMVMPQYITDLVYDNYPDLVFMTEEEAVAVELYNKAYATYNLGLFFDDTDFNRQPTDFRLVGLQKTIAYVLGVEPIEIKPKVSIKNYKGRPFKEKYACIAVQSTAGCKLWNNPSGWFNIVTYLKSVGLRVICIDRDHSFGNHLLWTHIPNGAEDFTGQRPLEERAWYLKNCEVFVGLSSGLSWLAWSVDAPVVMISGFTHPTNEFHTPYRVINWNACNSCWHDPNFAFEHKDFLWCPRHKDTPRHFECSRLISASHVINQIQRALGTVPLCSV